MPTALRAFRLTDADLAIIASLSETWGPVQPLDRTAVIREALKRAQEAEIRKKKGEDVTVQPANASKEP